MYLPDVLARLWFGAAVLSLCVHSSTAGAQSAAGASVSVEVTGTGATKWLAQADAIRIALQRTMAQLVIADRAVNESEILKDQVISTLNGFVERMD